MSLWGRVYRERRRVILPLLILAVLAVGGLGAGILPLRAHVSGLEAEAADADLALRMARADDAKARNEEKLKQQAELDLEKFYREILPRDFNAAADVTRYDLDKWAAETGLNSHSATVRPAREDDRKTSRLTRVTGQVSLKGRYDAVRRFLYRVETAEEFVIVEEVRLSQPGADTGNTLELNLLVSTAFLGSGPGQMRQSGVTR
jgi:hypothetical protein